MSYVPIDTTKIQQQIKHWDEAWKEMRRDDGIIKYFNFRQEMMMSIVRPGMNILEIGVWKGEFADFLYKLKPRHLILVDPFEGIVSSGDQNGNNVQHADLSVVYRTLLLNIQKAGIPNIQVIKEYSFNVLPKVPDNYLDIVYVDGDHSYEGVKRDLALAWPKIKSGGFLCGHDYRINHIKCQNNYNFGVQRAVDEFLQEKGLRLYAEALDGCTSYAIKKP